jgi:regulator of sigma E protease
MFGSTLTVDRSGEIFEIEVPDNFYRKYYDSKGPDFIGTGALKYFVRALIPGENAEKAGIKEGDTLLAINGEKIEAYDFGFLKEKVSQHKNKTISLTLKRGNESLDLNVPVSSKGTIGFSYSASQFVNPEYKLQKYTLLSAIKFGTGDAFESLVSNAKGLRKIFTGEEKASESIQGPIGIATIYGGQWEWPKFWFITGLLSMVLAFMNILPIPALDGGHVIFLLVESVTRKKFSDKFMERSQIVGMVLLLALMVFAVGNDIWKHVLN